MRRNATDRLLSELPGDRVALKAGRPVINGETATGEISFAQLLVPEIRRRVRLDQRAQRLDPTHQIQGARRVHRVPGAGPEPVATV